MCQHKPTKEKIKNYNNALSLMFCGGSWYYCHMCAKIICSKNVSSFHLDHLEQVE
jgi:hypothetical protein